MAANRPDNVYHYCDTNGFLGILKNRQLWMSDATLLNDYMERQWYLARVAEHLSGNDNLKLMQSIYTLSKRLIPYVTCFSRERDLLSQWRAYTNDGTGFAIGFSTKHFFEGVIGKLSDCGLNVATVFYNNDAIIKNVEYIMSKYKHMPDRLIFEILVNSTAFKNSCFCEENEIRIVYYPALDEFRDKRTLVSSIDFRCSGNRIVPYYKILFPVEAITNIMLGPKNFAREDRACLELFLASNGYDVSKIQICNSEASYR